MFHLELIILHFALSSRAHFSLQRCTKSSQMQMSDISEAPPTLIYVLPRSDGSRVDCGSSASARNETSAAQVRPASPSLLGSQGFWHA